ncbi:MAG TPA: hypothetical protein DEA05_01495 [Rhodobacteraceae bacterium]|nr:hypothetical protein [Paracoccaceae bacterium]
MAPVDRYSRVVAFLKVLLPLAALGILSTLFLISRGNDQVATIPFAEQDMADRMRSQQVTAPFFSGSTRKGDQITVTASIARPGGPDSPAEAEDMAARIITAEGTRITMDSRTGHFDMSADRATFTGDVRIDSSIGVRLRTDRLIAALSGVRAESPGEVWGQAVMGELTAGRMVLEAKNPGDPIHMLFNNGVKLVYDPKQPER